MLFLDLDDFKTSTTASATAPATSLLVAVGASTRRHPAARPTRRPGSAATSSRSCSRTSPTAEAPSSRRRPHPRRAARAVRRSQARRSSITRQHRHRARADAGTRRPRSCCATPTWRCTRPRSDGKGRYEIFEPSDARARRRAPRARRPTSARAIERDELRPPLPADRRRSQTGDIVGVEALVRWQHPDRGLVAPARVHPARRGDRAHRPDRPLGPRARRAARRPRGSWPRRQPPLTVSVNLSAPPARRSPTSSSDVAPTLAEHRPRPAPPRSSRSPRACCIARRRTPASAALERARRPRRAARDRRLRHRLLVARATCGGSRSTS